MLRILNPRFRQHVSVKEQGSITLGFLDATIALPGDVVVEVNDIVVRVAVDGSPTLSLPRREFETAHGKRSKPVLRFDETTFGSLVRAAFALPSVQNAVHAAEAARAAKKSA